MGQNFGQNTGIYIGDESAMDTRYMWNFNMCKDFKVQRIGAHWFVRLIQGYVDYQCPRDGLELLLIARRRWVMGGTRFRARGIDHDGNVANHCEVEQLVFHHTAHQPPLQVQANPH